jgi:S1-C subfamily serine protease
MNEEKPWSTGRPANAVNRKTVPDELGSQEKVVVKKLLSKTRSRSKFRFARVFFDLVLGRGLIGWVVGFVADHIRFGDFGTKNKSVRPSAGSQTRNQKPPPPPPGQKGSESENRTSIPLGKGSNISQKRSGQVTGGSRVFVGVTVSVVLLTVGLIVFKNQSTETLVVTPTETTETSENSVSELNSQTPSWEGIARSVALISIETEDEYRWGSGTLILDGSYLLTNYHVLIDETSIYEVAFAETYDVQPNETYSAIFVIGDESDDLAVLRIIDSFGEPVIVRGRDSFLPKNIIPALNDQITLIGYPGIGASENELTVTITNGEYSGRLTVDGDFFKTTAITSGGISGGAAFDSVGNFIGIPSASMGSDDFNTALGLIKPSQAAINLISKVKP